jgi:hypothetical protein
MLEDLFGDSYLIQAQFDAFSNAHKALRSALLPVIDSCEFGALPFVGDISDTSPNVKSDEYPHLHTQASAPSMMSALFDCYYDSQSPDQTRTLKYPGYLVLPTRFATLIENVNQTRLQLSKLIKLVNNADTQIGAIQEKDGWYVRQSELRALFASAGHTGLHLHQAFRQIQSISCNEVRLSLYLKKKASIRKTTVYEELKEIESKLEHDKANKALLLAKDKLLGIAGSAELGIVKKATYTPTVNLTSNSQDCPAQLSNVLPIIIFCDEPVTVSFNFKSFIAPKVRQARSGKKLAEAPIFPMSAYYLYESSLHK